MRRRRTMTVVVVLLILLCGEDVRADYSVQLATTALYHAKAAYCKAEAIFSWTCASCARNPGMQRVRVFTNATHSTQAFVGVNESMIVVSFRGTVDVTNWINIWIIFAFPTGTTTALGVLFTPASIANWSHCGRRCGGTYRNLLRGKESREFSSLDTALAAPWLHSPLPILCRRIRCSPVH
ncbi:putative lipase [Trypanosoma cruzi]|uniref:Putative lipase n=1 Tax=Trypanosoma cruzi TaxID=5693 RepID=A0A2V2VK36_TRYCR|nr:putative lipase [Trypanosoma cruzi]